MDLNVQTNPEVDMGSLEKRLNLLKKLKIAIETHEDEIYDALRKTWIRTMGNPI